MVKRSKAWGRDSLKFINELINSRIDEANTAQIAATTNVTTSEMKSKQRILNEHETENSAHRRRTRNRNRHAETDAKSDPPRTRTRERNGHAERRRGKARARGPSLSTGKDHICDDSDSDTGVRADLRANEKTSEKEGNQPKSGYSQNPTSTIINEMNNMAFDHLLLIHFMLRVMHRTFGEIGVLDQPQRRLRLIRMSYQCPHPRTPQQKQVAASSPEKQIAAAIATALNAAAREGTAPTIDCHTAARQHSHRTSTTASAQRPTRAHSNAQHALATAIAQT